MRAYNPDGSKAVVSIGSLYSGIGGLDLGLLAAFAEAGIPAKTWWMCEIEPFCQRVLAEHFAPEHGFFGDVATLFEPPQVDVLCGGFMCSDVSSAGKGAGLGFETRSGFTLHHLLRIVDEITPPYLVIENVASGAKRWLPTVVRELRSRGYLPRVIPLGAVDVGAPHLRRRVFVVAHHHQRREEQRRRGLFDLVGATLGHDAHGRGDGGEGQGVADPRQGGRGSRSGVEEHARQPDAGQRSDVSDAIGSELQQSRRRGRPSGSGAREPGVDGEAVADSERAGLEVEREQQARRQREAVERSGAAGGAAELGDAAESRRAGADGAGGSPGERRSSLLAERSGAAAASDGGTPQSGVGVRVDGLSFDVARHTFPAGRGEEQYDWEPPRAVPKEVATPERPAKLRALGNAVVPQCALVVGRVLIDVMRGRR